MRERQFTPRLECKRYFYVYEVEFAGLNIDFVAVDEAVSATIDENLGANAEGFDENYLPDRRLDSVYFYNSKNDGKDYVYLFATTTLLP